MHVRCGHSRKTYVKNRSKGHCRKTHVEAVFIVKRM
jgi:hypothetical protein